MADDGSNTDGFMTEHMEFADQLAGYVESEHPEFLVNKLYYDAYKKDMTAGTYPDVRSGLQKLLKDGLLLFNYTGHGGTTALSDEKVLTQTRYQPVYLYSSAGMGDGYLRFYAIR